MALRPTGPGDPRLPGRIPTRRVPAPVERADAPATPVRSRPTPGRRLKVAITDREIEAQIQRLVALIANDNIDPDAPPGSYLNILL